MTDPDMIPHIEALTAERDALAEKLERAVTGLVHAEAGLHEIEAGDMSTFEAIDLIRATLAAIQESADE